MSVRTKVGLGFNNYIRENEFGWDESAFSVFTTNSKDVEGRPLFNRFAKTDSMKVVPPPLSRDYTSLSDHINLDESQMSYGTKSSTSSDSNDKSSEVNTNDFASTDSSVKSSETKPNDSTSCASTSSVSTSENEDEIQSNVRTPIQEPIIVQDLPSYSCNSSDKNENTSRTSCNKNGYFNKKADCDFYEKQMVNQTVGIGVEPVHSRKKVNHQNQFVPQAILLRSGKVNIPPARPQPVPTGKPKMFAPVPTCRQTRPFLVPIDRGYSLSENPFPDAEDEGVFDSGYSRSMTELQQFNLFSISQICDKKNRVLFIDTECLVLSKDFKLPDETHASVDESVKWHRKMGHVNYKNMNRFVKGNLVRGLPPKLFKNDHTCVACCKGIKREYSNARTPQQNGVAERKNITLIEATRTMLADSKLPTMFWTEAVKTACYVLNRVLVTSPHNKTPYALLTGNIPSVSHFKPFGCHVTILNTSDHLGKFDGKADEGYIVGYSASYKHDKSNQSAGTQEDTTNHAGTQDDDSNSDCDEQVIIVPSCPSHSIQGTGLKDTSGDEVDDSPLNSADVIFQKELARLKDQEHRATSDAESLGSGFENDTEELTKRESAKTVPPGSIPVPAGDIMVSTDDVHVHTSSSTDSFFNDKPTTRFPSPSDLGNHDPSPGIFSSSSYDHEFGAALNNVASTVEVNPMNVKSAFLYGRINEEVYVTQPKGFVDPQHPKKVYKVVKTLYGLHQAPRACQDKYVQEILNKFYLRSVRMATTPYEALKPKSKNEYDSLVNVHLYRSMIGSLMYLIASRPDIMFAVSACLRNQVTPTTLNLEAVKKIFKYLKGQPKLGLWYTRESAFVLEAYSDSDYVGANKDRKSTTGGCQFLGKRLISWQCKKQTIVATSSTEAEYVAAAANCCGQDRKSTTGGCQFLGKRLISWQCKKQTIVATSSTEAEYVAAAANCCGQVLWIQNQLLDYGSLELGPLAIQATIDKTPYTINEDLLRSQLQLADNGGIDDLSISEIYSGMDNLGYVTEGKLTFFKNKFSPQWRFLVHTILHCLGTKC
nr:hypothetical protein [Tanacetum cinerariifolium]